MAVLGFVRFGLLGVAVEDVLDYFAVTLGSMERRVFFDTPYFGVGYLRFGFHRADVVHSEAEDVAVFDGIDDGIRMQLLAEGLFGGGIVGVFGVNGILGKDRCAGEAEDHVFLEFLPDETSHLAELRTVALIEDHDDIGVQDLDVFRSATQECCEFLDGRDDNMTARVV